MDKFTDIELYHRIGQNTNLYVCGEVLISLSKVYGHDWENKLHLTKKTPQHWQTSEEHSYTSQTKNISLQTSKFISEATN